MNIPFSVSGIDAHDPQPHNTLPLSAITDRIFGFNSRDERSRPFNLLRGQLTRMVNSGDLRTVAITSATPKVGKSFVASNLGAAMGRLPDMSTYLFDLDLRRSSVAKYYGLQGQVGITEYLAGGNHSLDDIAWQVEDQHLVIYPSFSDKVLSSELLSSARMDEMIAMMRSLRGPALCICDLPPVFANDDAVIVTEKVDGYILVIEEGVTTAKQVKDSMRLLRPARCLGTVLNRYYGGLSGDDYGYGYGNGSYSDYYN